MQQLPLGNIPGVPTLPVSKGNICYGYPNIGPCWNYSIAKKLKWGGACCCSCYDAAIDGASVAMRVAVSQPLLLMVLPMRPLTVLARLWQLAVRGKAVASIDEIECLAIGVAIGSVTNGGE
ncbi:uncharacterized protein LOC115629422 [Scaptodrosophila lebanonensis]|uniref:Uncharacterized protein LOC115629422 n=1 Tax=Drosophila lebanonensis TaxID=7225 RepID=A0A6J2U2M8_DROLE|nr:uncharacterized protein LOC115629422 [Scaptodrosophila lebanonensis]